LIKVWEISRAHPFLGTKRHGSWNTGGTSVGDQEAI
jgi:hypothetical protein